ncbi:MAG: DUF393 domain-containing protein [Sphingobacteriales bacterium]|nr:MAG: DUF393 domain-containing protein [Sphingobacteriales bacterium]
MKTLIYDNECPLCVAYTGAFVKTGLLKKEGRKKFNEVDQQMLANLDAARMHNEIPLIEKETGKVWYGMDALLEILGSKFPLLKKTGQLKIINWFLKKLYKLVSYNRKVIVAVPPSGYDCSPHFNIRYRIIFLLAGLVLNSCLFTQSVPFFIHHIFPDAQHLQEVHFLLVTLNIAIAVILGTKKGLEYLGQVNMLAFISLACLIPIVFFQQLIPGGFAIFFTGLISCFISREYIRRMKYANIIGQNNAVVILNIITVAAAIMYLIN